MHGTVRGMANVAIICSFGVKAFVLCFKQKRRNGKTVKLMALLNPYSNFLNSETLSILLNAISFSKVIFKLFVLLPLRKLENIFSISSLM